MSGCLGRNWRWSELITSEIPTPFILSLVNVTLLMANSEMESHEQEGRVALQRRDRRKRCFETFIIQNLSCGVDAEALIACNINSLVVVLNALREFVQPKEQLKATLDSMGWLVGINLIVNKECEFDKHFKLMYHSMTLFNGESINVETVRLYLDKRLYQRLIKRLKVIVQEIVSPQDGMIYLPILLLEEKIRQCHQLIHRTVRCGSRSIVNLLEDKFYNISVKHISSLQLALHCDFCQGLTEKVNG